MAVEGDGEPVAWVTSVDVPDSGRVWFALSDLRGQTGLMPVLLDGGEDEQDYFFYWPPKVAEVDRLDAGTVLAAFWDGQFEDTSGPAELYDTPLSNQFLGLGQPPPGGHGLGDIVSAIVKVMTDPSANAELERLNEIDRRNAVPLPFPPAEPDPREGQPFPGLAPPAGDGLSQAERDAALASLEPARVGLVPARRPADVPATVGWAVFGADGPSEFGPVQWSANAVWVGSVLRSFEDRFGATLLKLGPGAELRLLAERPPRTLEHATRIAAEHSVFCDECAGQGLREVPDIAAALVGAPIWTFWWD
jgi:hypothetical protein